MDHITIKTLARALGLSQGTVSKALKDSHEISEATKKKVREFARKLHYVPNPYASSLRKRKSKTIAVVLPEVADSFFSLAINGIESVAQEKGYHVLIYLTHERVLKEQDILEDFKSGRVDGVLISLSRETTGNSHLHDLQDAGIPVVFFDRVAADMDAAKVTTNDFDSGYTATQHLIEKGCTHIAYLSLSNTLAITNERMRGYERALADHHSGKKKKHIVFCHDELSKDYEVIRNMMTRKNYPDGILVSVEKLAIPVYQVCAELKLVIPGNVKVISFSNLASAFLWKPSLSTITQPAFEIGKTSATLLFKALEKRSFVLNDKHVVIPSVLVARDSTG